MNPKEIVRQGYNQISYAYRTDSDGSHTSDYIDWLTPLLEQVPAGEAVLDLGCGCGNPVAQLLAEKYAYTGVDISEVQIERARRLVPAGRFLRADFADLDLPQDFFAAVLSFYAIIHLPLTEQPALFDRIASWLKPKGYLLATVGHKAWTGTENNWHGARMYWSHADEMTYLNWLKERNFRLEWRRFIPEGDGGHSLVFAQYEANLRENPLSTKLPPK